MLNVFFCILVYHSKMLIKEDQISQVLTGMQEKLRKTTRTIYRL